MKGGVGYRVYNARFHEGVCLGGDMYFGGCCPQGCFLECLFLGVSRMYGTFSLYSLFHRSLFVLSRDLVV